MSLSSGVLVSLSSSASFFAANLNCRVAKVKFI